MKFITIAVFSDPIQANLIKSRLASAGISAILLDEHMESILPIYSHAIGHIKLQVSKADLKMALKLLSNEHAQEQPIDDFDMKAENENLNCIKCPNCFSLNLYKEGFSKKSLLGLIFLGFPIPILSNRFHCFDCGYQWKEKK